jgi:pectate lyase
MMALLTMTAIVLVVVLLAAPAREAQGEMLNAQSGFSLLTTGTPGGGDELLVVVDNATQRMVMYRLMGNNMEVFAAADLGRMMGPARGR